MMAIKVSGSEIAKLFAKLSVQCHKSDNFKVLFMLPFQNLMTSKSQLKHIPLVDLLIVVNYRKKVERNFEKEEEEERGKENMTK